MTANARPHRRADPPVDAAALSGPGPAPDPRPDLPFGRLSDPSSDAVAGVPLPREFFARGVLEVAPELLGKVLAVGACSGRIVEVEAYRQDDPASHSFRGSTARNATMFGVPGHLYVYLSYGMHHCANVVTGAVGQGEAVLIRAIAPVAGVDEMRTRRRPGTPHVRLADGPGKLCAALGLTRSDDGVDLCAGDRARILDDGVAPPIRPRTTPRIGITKAVELPWRFVVP